jgi:hypothetical protein
MSLRLLPLFDLFSGPSTKYALITLFCLVTLSDHGLDSLFAEADEAKRRQTMYALGIAGGSPPAHIFCVHVFFVLAAGQPSFFLKFFQRPRVLPNSCLLRVEK